MSLANVSQLLLRNIELLSAAELLLVNMPDDQLAKEISTTYPNTNLSFFDTNYANHIAHKNLAIGSTDFDSHYHTEIKHDLVVMRFPKSKNELSYTLANLSEHLTAEASILIVGENNSGIKSLAKQGKALFSYCEKVDAARHCILFDTSLSPLAHASFTPDDWYHEYQVELPDITLKIAALPGVFSQEKLDVGTKVLLENFPVHLSGEILDFGCGAGVIAAFLGLKFPECKLNLTDVSALALASAKKTLALNELSGNVFATDSMSNIQNSYQYVISNPPFHQGVKTNYQATELFLNNIEKNIFSRGSLIVVANSFLQYQPLMNKAFKQVKPLVKSNGFTVYQANK